jgi:hypothetical protein
MKTTKTNATKEPESPNDLNTNKNTITFVYALQNLSIIHSVIFNLKQKCGCVFEPFKKLARLHGSLKSTKVYASVTVSM